MKGIVELIHTLEVTGGETLTDDELQAAISGIYHVAVLLDNARIEVAVHDSAVVLNGTVSNAYQRTHAARLVWQSGAKHVDMRGVRVN